MFRWSAIVRAIRFQPVGELFFQKSARSSLGTWSANGCRARRPESRDARRSDSRRRFARRRERRSSIGVIEYLDRPEFYANRFYQGYLVLNYARMLHDLTVGRPGSKRAGAGWAKARFAPAWADLIDRAAWGGHRPNPAVAVREPADPTDYEWTLEFVRLIMGEAERDSRLGGLEGAVKAPFLYMYLPTCKPYIILHVCQRIRRANRHR